MMSTEKRAVRVLRCLHWYTVHSALFALLPPQRRSMPRGAPPPHAPQVAGRRIEQTHKDRQSRHRPQTYTEKKFPIATPKYLVFALLDARDTKDVVLSNRAGRKHGRKSQTKGEQKTN